MSSEVPKAILRQLKDPFETRLIKWRVGGGSKVLAYIDARDVMKRLDDVMGADGWQDKYIPIDGGFICELSLKIGDEWITRSNAADYTKVEAIKGGASNALKRAASTWGIGRYLYYLDPNKFNANNVAQWPKWALPGAVLNWEDVAELEADTETGMDEQEVAGLVVKTIDRIREAKTTKELNGIVKELSGEEQAVLVDIITNKTEELLSGNNKS